MSPAYAGNFMSKLPDWWDRVKAWFRDKFNR